MTVLYSNLCYKITALYLVVDPAYRFSYGVVPIGTLHVHFPTGFK